MVLEADVGPPKKAVPTKACRLALRRLQVQRAALKGRPLQTSAELYGGRVVDATPLGEPTNGRAACRNRIRRVAVIVRAYDPREFATLYKLDQSCFPPGIAYSRMMLNYFLKQPAAECLVAADGSRIVGFILTEENPPLAHIITLDVAESHRRQRVGTTLLVESERNLALRGVRTILLETAIDNAAGIAFWQHHGYRIEATLKRYHLGRIDAYEMRKIFSTGAHRQPAPKET